MVKAYHKLLNSEDDNVRYVAGIGVQPVLILKSAMRQSRGRQSLVQMGVSRGFDVTETSASQELFRLVRMVTSKLIVDPADVAKATEDDWAK